MESLTFVLGERKVELVAPTPRRGARITVFYRRTLPKMTRSHLLLKTVRSFRRHCVFLPVGAPHIFIHTWTESVSIFPPSLCLVVLGGRSCENNPDDSARRAGGGTRRLPRKKNRRCEAAKPSANPSCRWCDGAAAPHRAGPTRRRVLAAAEGS